MPDDPKNPQLGSVVFDGGEFTYLVDLNPQEMLGKRTEQPGFDVVKEEIIANQAEWGAKAGMTDDDFTQFQLCNDRITRIDAFITPVMKFLEMLTETRVMLEDERQRVVLNVAQAVDRRSIREPMLIAKYQKTREYRSAIAKKGVKTRKMNQAAQAPESPAPPPADS